MRLVALTLCLSVAFLPVISTAQDTTEEQSAEQSPVAATAAQPPPSPPQDAEIVALEAARGHMEKGQEFYMRGMYIEAVEEFLAAHRAHAHAAFLFNAGVAFERLRDWGRAIEQFERYLTAEPTAADRADVEARIARVRQRQATAQAALAAQNNGTPATAPDGTTIAANPATSPSGATTVATTTPSGTTTTTSPSGATTTTTTNPEPPPDSASQDMKSLLTIRSNPAGARVTIKQNGVNVASGAAPFSQSLDDGEYRVVVEHPDYRTIETPVFVRSGKVYVIIVEMSQGQFLGFLRVVTDIPGASVFLDNREEGALGRTPFQNSVSTGTHRIWIEKPGFQTIEREVEVGVGDEVVVRSELERVTHGRLRVVANVRGAQVFVDGQLQGVVPFEGDVPAGEHEIRVDGEDMKSWSSTMTILQGQVTPARVRLRPAVGRAAAWVTASVSALILGGSIATGVLANNLHSEIESDARAGRLASDDPRIARGRWMYIGADAGFGLTAVFAGIALYYFLRDPLPDSEATILEPRDWAFIPSVDATGAGGSLVVRF